MRDLSSPIAYRDIQNADGYRIGDNGSVQSCRIKGNAVDRGPWKNLSLYRRPYGARYVVVCLRPEPGGKVVQYYVHELVLRHFVGPCPEGMECCHKDGDTSNNNLYNLKWGTHTENMEDMRRHGTMKVGTKSHHAKINEADVIGIRKLYRTGAISQKEIGKIFGLAQKTISQIVRLNKWKHVS